MSSTDISNWFKTWYRKKTNSNPFSRLEGFSAVNAKIYKYNDSEDNKIIPLWTCNSVVREIRNGAFFKETDCFTDKSRAQRTKCIGMLMRIFVLIFGTQRFKETNKCCAVNG